MKIEISKEQISNIAEKIAMCVEYLKTDVQPHLIKTDKLIIPAGDCEELELHITSKTLHIVEISPWLFEIPRKRTYTLTKNKKKNKEDKHYICEAHPEAAIEFLKSWDKIKSTLAADVAKKVEEVDKIDSFIDGFQL